MVNKSVDIGSIRIIDNHGESIRVVVATGPSLPYRYDQLEGEGETLAEALADLLDQIEEIPE